MKKFLSAFVLLLSGLSAYSADVFTPDIMYRVDYFEDLLIMAIDGNLDLHFTVTSRTEDSTTISILEKNGFGIEKTITIPFSEDDIRHFGTYSNNGVNEGEVWLTQSLFNSDDKWEYVIKDEDSESLLVYNEDAVCLGSIQNGLVLDAILISGDYACFFGYDDDGDLLCSFTSKGNGVQAINLNEAKSVYTHPNPVRSNEKLTVELSAPLSENGKLKIMDTNGRICFRKNVAAGENKVIVPSMRLRKGMYVYVVEAGGRIIGTDKIIVD